MTSTEPQTDPTPPAPAASPPPADPALGPLVRRAVARRRYATLATTAPSGQAHVAGVLYDLVDGELWISTSRASAKARNAAARPHVALSVAVRRLPLGPPSSVHLRGRASVVDLDDPVLRDLARRGRLPRTTGHGELELEGGCFLRVALAGRVPTYGLGMSLVALARHPLTAGRVADVDWR